MEREELARDAAEHCKSSFWCRRHSRAIPLIVDSCIDTYPQDEALTVNEYESKVRNNFFDAHCGKGRRFGNPVAIWIILNVVLPVVVKWFLEWLGKWGSDDRLEVVNDLKTGK